MHSCDNAAFVVEGNHKAAHIGQMIHLHEYPVCQTAHHIIGVEMLHIHCGCKGRYAVGYTNSLLQVTAELEPVARMHHIPYQNDHKEYEYEHNHGNVKVTVGALQFPAVILNIPLAVVELEQFQVGIIIIAVDAPVTQRQGRYGNLVTQPEHGLVISGEPVLKPVCLGRNKAVSYGQ